MIKLDGVGPVDNKPSTNKLHHFVKKRRRKQRKKKKEKKTQDIWHLICDTWHVTCDMWHVTRDRWHVTCCGGWTFSQNLMVSDIWYLEDWEEKAHGLSESMNNRGACRTASATPGLLISKSVRDPFPSLAWRYGQAQTIWDGASSNKIYYIAHA